MQFQKHNFHYNFLNAVETDKDVAWDILINELNELILEYPKEVSEIIAQSGHRLPNNPSPKDKLDLINEHVYQDERLRKGLLRLVGKRHTNPHYNADAGEHDEMVFSGAGAEDFNAAGEAANDEETLNFVFAGAGNLVAGIKDKVQGAAMKLKNKQKAEKNLAAKEKQRNLPVSRSKGSMSPGKIIGISLAAVAAISLVAFLIYKSNKSEAK